MKILALELSTARGSIFSPDDDVDPSAALGTSFEREWANDRKHSGIFFENLAQLVKELGKPEKIIVGLGPGSYAGTRIAISAAIGLQASGGTGSGPSAKTSGRHPPRRAGFGRSSTTFGVRLVGYPSICAIETEAGDYCMIGDARRSSFYFARIRAHDLAEGPTLLSEAELKEKMDTVKEDMSIFCSEPLPQFERAVLRYPSAKILAKLARDPHRAFALPPLEPMYLREPHITLPR
ncbi:MAG: tRNA threonylcarbamoyladenosine biosynthesis protein TsaB [Verrucomicrobiota bacterium]